MPKPLAERRRWLTSKLTGIIAYIVVDIEEKYILSYSIAYSISTTPDPSLPATSGSGTDFNGAASGVVSAGSSAKLDPRVGTGPCAL